MSGKSKKLAFKPEVVQSTNFTDERNQKVFFVTESFTEAKNMILKYGKVNIIIIVNDN